MTDRIVLRKGEMGSRTATQTPANGVDVTGLRSAEVVTRIGAVANIANSPQPSWTLSLQHSDTVNSGFVNCSADDIVMSQDGDADEDGTNGIFAVIDDAALDDRFYRIGYIGGKKFVRMVATAAATPGATIIEWHVIGEPLLQPGVDA